MIQPALCFQFLPSRLTYFPRPDFLFATERENEREGFGEKSFPPKRKGICFECSHHVMGGEPSSSVEFEIDKLVKS